MKLCDYGCGQEAKYPFKNGKWCCSKHYSLCLISRKKNSKAKKGRILSEEHKKKISKSMKGKNTGPLSEDHIKKLRKANKGKTLSSEHKKKIGESNKGKHSIPCLEETKKKIGIGNKSTIKYINKQYPFFSKIEEMRYNPECSDEKEIQVHCKNHECENSKEKGGWFTPTYNQLYERIRQLENKNGNGGSYFYCSQHCKDTCELYNLNGDPFKNNNLPYTYAEYKVCRAVVFERENTLCEYCGEPATDMHHIFPVKIEPFFALDPDYCVACCEKHHYKYAHKDECSTGNLAKIVCSVE
jgi:hypothetical protein